MRTLNVTKWYILELWKYLIKRLDQSCMAWKLKGIALPSDECHFVTWITLALLCSASHKISCESNLFCYHLLPSLWNDRPSFGICTAFTTRPLHSLARGFVYKTFFFPTAFPIHELALDGKYGQWLHLLILSFKRTTLPCFWNFTIKLWFKGSWPHHTGEMEWHHTCMDLQVYLSMASLQSEL